MIVFTHRGLEPSKKNSFPESSYEAFANHLQRGFGIEFDPNFCKDGIVVSHDATLQRITEGKDTRPFSEISMDELSKVCYGKEKQGKIPTFDELLQLLEKSKSSLHALHLKGKYQSRENIDILLTSLQNHQKILSKILIFDLKPESADYMKTREPRLNIAPSVAHPHDIKRYNILVAKTLITVKEAIKHKKIFDWVWLDEWDTVDTAGKEKYFYTKETFKKLKSAGYKIALVTPELHGTSPGLYGGESHKDAKDLPTLLKRTKEILALQPDAICTDYPEEVSML